MIIAKRPRRGRLDLFCAQPFSHTQGHRDVMGTQNTKSSERCFICSSANIQQDFPSKKIVRAPLPLRSRKIFWAVFHLQQCGDPTELSQKNSSRTPPITQQKNLLGSASFAAVYCTALHCIALLILEILGQKTTFTLGTIKKMYV